MRLLQDEEGGRCFLIVLGYTPSLEAADRVEAAALFTGHRCVQTVFGYPNEDAFEKDPRGRLGHGCYEIDGSRWAEHVEDYNHRSFGSGSLWAADRLHHYFIGSKDGSCQILAHSLDCEPLPDLSIRQVLDLVEARRIGR